MKRNLLCLLIIVLGISINSYAQTNNWTGATDSNWDEPTNWSTGLVPAAGEKVQINITDTITGTNLGRAVPGRIRVFANVVVTLDLDLTLAGISGISQVIQLNNGGTLNLGDGVTPRTFTISTVSTSSIALTNGGTNVVVAANSTVNMTGAVTSIRVSGLGDTLTNNGTINITGYSSVGISVEGNGTFNNNDSIIVSAPSAAASDGVKLTGGIFNNSGVLNSATGAGAGTADNPLSVEGGTFDNKSTGVVNLACDDAIPRGAVLVSSGSLLNSGKLNANDGGNNNRRILATGTGSITNNVCGIIDMGNGRFSCEGGSFTNNGLLKTTYSANSLTRLTGGGTATNNGFAIAGGAQGWTGTDNGLTLVGVTNFTVDAAGSCLATDIGINVAHDWYSDAAMTTLVGSNDASGNLVFLDTIFSASGSHTLYTCYDTSIVLTVDSIDGNCIVGQGSVNAETVWDGGGDGSSWDDPLNWTSDLVPGDSTHVIFPQNLTVTITSSVSNNAAERITVDTNSIVNLELDLIVLDTNSINNSIIVMDSSTLQLGSTTTAHTFLFGCAINKDVVSVRGEMSEFIVSSMATLNVTSGLHCLRTTKATALLTNNGTINLSGYNVRGINVSSGSMTNNGALNISVGNASSNDGIHIPSAGTFNNGINGVLTITKVNDDAINLSGTLNNEGLLNFVVKDTATATNVGILIGGSLNNMSTGTINGNIGLSTVGVGIQCKTAGTLTNDGLISLANGNSAERFENQGTTVNNVCAQINVNDGLLFNNGGTFTNNGLFTGTYAGSCINNTAGTAINNGFYSYLSPSDSFATTGAGITIDNGLEALATIDAQNSCDISDIGIDVAADWYSDALGQNLVGTSDVSGNLVFLDTIFSTAGTDTLYTCYGSAVTLIVDNIDGNCVVSQTPVIVSGETVWDGGGDGLSWDDPINWDNDLVPNDSSDVIFPRDLTVTVTSSVSNNVAERITVDTNSTVILDLDLTILDTNSTNNCIIVLDSSTLQLGSATTAHTIALGCAINRDVVSVRGEMSEFIVSSMATLNITSGLHCLRTTKSTALLTNNGTINLSGYNVRGINVSSGTMTNNGTLNITVGNASSNDGIHIPSAGTFNNGINGVVTITQANDDAINLTGTLNNEGLLNFVVKDAAIATNVGIVIGGSFNNMSTGTINGDIGLSTVGIGIQCNGSGVLTNDGLISLTNGNSNERIKNQGTTVNNACAEININDGHLFNNGGTFTNSGLLTADSSINNAAGTVTNNGFYSYLSPSDPFATGAGTSIDNGVAAFATIDAQNSCTLSGIGINVGTNWYSDALGQNLVGTSDALGDLVFLDTIYSTSGAHTIYTTCYGSAVALTVDNLAGNCVVGQVVVNDNTETIWNGDGDGLSWDDPFNWTSDLVPGDSTHVIFPQDLTVTVTSSVSNNAAERMTIDTNSTVILELDLMILDTNSTNNCIIVMDSSTLQLGSATTAHTVDLGCAINRDVISVRGEMSELIVASMATVNITSGLNNLRTTKATALLTNNGTINLSGYNSRGINVTNGAITNNGTLTIDAGNASSNDGIHLPAAGTFNNGTNGVLVITKVNDDAINILGTFNNEGLINFVVKDGAAAANIGIIVGTGSVAGTFNNMSTGTINGDVGLSTVGVGMQTKTAGILTNDGLINLTNGNPNKRFDNQGTLVNNECAEINVNDGLLVNNDGTFTNNGLFTGGSSINNTGGTATNNAFYSYPSPSDPFATGAGTTIDNGLSTSATIDAQGACTIPGVGIGVGTDWYSDALGQNLVGTSDASGTLVFLDTIFNGSGPHTIYTACYGSAVALTIDNLAGNCVVAQAGVDISVAVDLSEYTGTFTTVYISGDFNNWNGTANPLTNQSGNIWSGTITVTPSDSIEYKFTLDDWNVQESFAGGESCTKTSGNFTNRFLAYGASDVNIGVVCWESCLDCSSNTEKTILTAAFEMMPNPANDFLQLSFDDAFVATEKTLFVRNAVGQLVYTSTINHVDTYKLNTSEFSSGLYFITVQTEKGVQTKRLLVNHN